MKDKKLVTLLKMFILTMGLLGIYIAIVSKGGSKDEEKSSDAIYDFAMGTSVSITLYGIDDKEIIAGDIVRSINNLSDNVISWRAEGSELYALNSSYEAGKPYAVSQELNEILTMSLKICEDSEGALDITIRPLANLWNIESATVDTFKIPDFLEVGDMVSQIGYEHISLTDDGVILDQKDMILDFGATGKGYALDIIRDELISVGADGAIISIGGSVLVYGEKTDGKPWTVGIRDPFGPAGDMVGYINFEGNTNICVSTSGDYEKYVEMYGERYHHILDRETGYPASAGLVSVTVVCESGLVSDGLSTACFVLGYDKSLPLLEKYGAEAIFISTEGEIIVTEGLQDKFTEE